MGLTFPEIEVATPAQPEATELVEFVIFGEDANLQRRGLRPVSTVP